MGFGSYDESEHERREASPDDDDVEVSRHGDGHHGESSFELEESTDSMLDQLREIKAKQAEDDEAADS